MYRNMSASSFVTVALLAAGVVSCSGGGDGERLLEGHGRERTRRELLRVQFTDASGGSATAEVDFDDLGTLFEDDCSVPLTPLYPPPLDDNKCGVAIMKAEKSLCAAHRFMELAQIVAPQPFLAHGDPATAVVPPGVEFPANAFAGSIPPQSPDVNALLAAHAFASARAASERAARALESTRPAFDLPTADACSLALLNVDFPHATGSVASGETLARHAAFVMLESGDIARESAARMTELGLAVADAHFSEETLSGRGARRAWVAADDISRGRIAGTLAGGAFPLAPFEGEPEPVVDPLDSALGGALPSVATYGYCPAADLSGGAERAIAALRATGIPALVLADAAISNDELLVDWGAPESSTDSIRSRLGALYSSAELAASTSPSEVLRYLGVTSTDLADARDYLVHEFDAFERSDQPVPDDVASSGATLPFARARGIVSPPGPMMPEYYEAIASYREPVLDDTALVYPNDWQLSGSTAPGAWTEPGVGGQIDEEASALIELLRLTPADGGVIPGPARDLLVAQAAELDGRRTERLYVCLHNEMVAEGDKLRVRIYHREPAAPPPAYYLIYGYRALECAVHGTMDGYPCTSSDIVSVGNVSGAEEVVPGAETGLRRFSDIYVNNVFNTMAPGGRHLLFVVRRVSDEVQPGGFALLRGFVPYLPDPTAASTPESAGWLYCTSYAAVDGLAEDVATVLAPDRSHCSRPAESCAGIPSDQRLPLEDDLIGDGDDFESSWRHYLTEAEQAANTADLLGEQLVREGLELDTRVESAIDELAELCGARINVDLAIRDVDPASLPATCTSDTDCPGDYTCPVPGGACVLELPATCTTSLECPDNYACSLTAGQCVFDGLAAVRNAATDLSDGDAQRLFACIGDGTTVDVTLGQTSLCAWHDPTGVFCGRPEGEMGLPSECPSVALGEIATCPVLPAGYREVGPTEPLRFFSEGDGATGGGNSGARPPCQELADLRSSPLPAVRSAAFREVVDAGGTYWAYANVRDLARRLDWRPIAGNVSEVLVDGETLFSTRPRVETTSFPCGVAGEGYFGDILCGPRSASPDNPGSIFCAQSMCLRTGAANRIRRARFNDRMARAVLAARILTGAPLAGMDMPYYPWLNATEDVAEGGDDHPPVYGDLQWKMMGDSPDDPSGLDFYRSVQGFFDPGDPEFSSQFGAGNPSWRAFIVGYPVAPTTGDCGDSGNLERDLPVGAEWARAPYAYYGSGDGTMEVFDDAVDCDDARASFGIDDYDNNFPLVVRPLSALADLPASAELVAPAFWGGLSGADGSGLLRRMLLRAEAANISSLRVAVNPELGRLRGLTKYWYGSDANPDMYLAVSGVDPSRQCDGNDEGNDYYYCRRWSLGGPDGGWDYANSAAGNRAFISRNGITETSVLDALELLCAVQDTRAVGVNPTIGMPPINNLDDLLNARTFLEDVKRNAEANYARTLFADFPEAAIPDLRNQPGGDSNVAGVYGTKVSELRAAMLELADQKRQIGIEVDVFGSQLDVVRSEVNVLHIRSEIADVELGATIGNQVTSCLNACGRLVSSLKWTDNAINWGAPSTGAAIEAAATCANSGVQIGFANRINTLTGGVLTEEQNRALGAAETEMFAALGRIGDHMTAINVQSELIVSRLRDLETNRQAARSALARASLLDSDAAAHEYPVNTVMRRRLSTTAIRYEAALRNAKRLAVLAKLAIEQRLGMRLSSMTDPMTLLDEPPARWEADVCRLTGIDYERLRRAGVRPGTDETTDIDAGVPPGDAGGGTVPADDGITNYADAYIGDYVRKLASVVESYRLDFPYQYGSDSTVISLRDEIMRIRTECERPGYNGLYNAGHLDALAGPGIREHGWTREGCVAATPPVDGGTYASPPCVEAVALDETEWPEPVNESIPLITRRSPDLGALIGYRMHFGDETALGSLTAATRVVQWVTVPAGRHRLSWYGRYPDLFLDPAAVVQLVVDNEVEEALPFGTPVISRSAGGGGWKRYYAYFEIDDESRIGIVIDPGYTTAPVVADVELGGFMLEDVSDTYVALPTGIDTSNADPLDDHYPRPFMDTTETLSRMLNVCVDQNGEQFRLHGWSRGCTKVCSDGYGTDCISLASTEQCYHETQFTVTQRGIERGEIVQAGGFAYGNFNYRIESIGVNFVGSYTRDCEDAELYGYSSDACYANGTIPYSLSHYGPFTVRNHRGDDYDAPLFNGRIERARGLAAERYLTNPLSGADHALSDRLLRSEFRGRPINGTYVFRVWDDPGVEFSSIDDVQILLNYRYWTRFE